jgi:hypothetical protein
MPAEDCVRLQDAQAAPPTRPETGQANPQQSVRLPKAKTWRALLQECDLTAESQGLSLLSRPGPKCRDQSQKDDENEVIVETMMISRTDRKPAFSIWAGFSVSTPLGFRDIVMGWCPCPSRSWGGARYATSGIHCTVERHG